MRREVKNTISNIFRLASSFVETLSGDRGTGTAIILKALEKPARQIAENAGTEGSASIAEIMRHPAGVGFNAAMGEYTNTMISLLVKK